MKLVKKERSYKGAKVKILTDDENYIDLAFDELVKQRKIVEDYIKKNPEFLSSLLPLKVKKKDPEIIRLMAEGSFIAGVGPMAAVAGTIAEFMARKMISEGAKVALVENGGDIFAITNVPLNIGIYAGYTKLADKLAFVLDGKNTPISICSSSKLGHSKSFGDCDLATVFSRKSYVADAVATAVGNMVKKDKDISKSLEWAMKLKDVLGVLIVKDSNMGLIGDVPLLVANKDDGLKEKVTKEDFYKL